MTVGRLGLAHPALATAGGSALWTLINSLYQQIGDAVTGRYFTASAVANGATVTFTHGFGAPFSEYRFCLYLASSGTITSRVFSGWTVAANATTPTLAIDITNNSGSTSDIIVVLTHTGGNIAYTYMDMYQLASTPTSPASGFTRLYPKSDGNLYSLSAAGIEQAIGAGGSSGKDYIPTASQSGVGQWVGAGSITLSTSTLTSELPRPFTTKQGLKIVPSTTPVFTYTTSNGSQVFTSTTPHGMSTGYVLYLTGGTLPTGFSTTTPYYVNVLSTTTFNLATTMANLTAGSYVTVGTAGSGTNQAIYNVAYLRFTLDAADYSIKQQLSFVQNALSGYVAGDFRLDVWSNTASGYTGTWNRLSLTPSDTAQNSFLLAALGAVRTTFDAPGSAAPYLEVRLVSVNMAHNLVISDLHSGPGTTPQAAVVGPWISYTPTGAWTTNTTYSGRYRQVGDAYQFRVTIATSGAPTAADFTMNFLPSGYSVNTASLPATPSTTNALTVGVATLSNNGGTFYPGSVTLISTTLVRVVHAVPGSNIGVVGYTNPFTFGAGGFIQLDFLVPITEITGQGVVNIGQNDLMYASNSDNSSTATNTTSFATGSAGSLIPNGATGTTYQRYVRFPNPVPAGVTPYLEVQEGGTGLWARFDARLGPFVTQGTNSYGALVGQVSSTNFTDYNVVFQPGGIKPSNATYAGAGSAFSTISTWNWRLTAGLPGQASGFGPYVPGASAGLVPVSGLPGQTSGIAVSSGILGEKIEGALTAITLGGTTYGTSIGTVTLTAGIWLLGVNSNISKGTANTAYAVVRLQNTTDGTTTITGTTLISSAQGVTLAPFTLMGYTVISGTKTFALQGYDPNNQGTIVIATNSGGIFAANNIVAVRVG